MKTILLINGPNLNNLGKRDPSMYGDVSLSDIEANLKELAKKSECTIKSFQSNHEGDIVDFMQQQSSTADGLIINPGALTGVGFSIVDAIIDSHIPVVEVHISNIHAREEFRSKSVVAPVSIGQISGLGNKGYALALEFLIEHLKN